MWGVGDKECIQNFQFFEEGGILKNVHLKDQESSVEDERWMELGWDRVQ
jgi:hypothetical protein